MFKNIFSGHISFVASISLVGALGLTGCNSDNSTTTVPTTPDPDTEVVTRTLSGVVIDGYVSGATVTFGDYSATTLTDGTFTISYEETIEREKKTVKSKGGNDTATGEAFEGILKSIGDAGDTNIVLTPLTTIVASLVESGVSEDEAVAKVSTQLGLPASIINADPIATLKNGTATEKAAAASAIKKALVIQKMTETFAKSVGADDGAYESVMAAISDSLNSGKTFDEVISDTDSIAAAVASKLGADDIMTSKLTAASSSAKAVAKVVNDMDETVFTAEGADVDAILTSKSKAIEVATSAIEKKVEAIAAATDTDTIAAAQTAAEEVTKAVTMLGGVEGIAATMDAQAATLAAGETLDASQFTDSFLSDETVATQSASYDSLVASGFTEDMILDVAKETTKGTSVDDAVAVVVAAAVAAGTIEDGAIDTTTVVNTVTTSKDAADSAAASAKDSSIDSTTPTCEDGQSLVNGVCVDDAPTTPTCEDGQSLVDGVCVDDAPTTPTCEDGQSLVNGVCVADNTETPVVTPPVVPPTTTNYDKLTISNPVTIGTDDAKRDVTITNGTMNTVEYTAFNNADDASGLYNLAFSLTNPTTDGFEANDTKDVTLAAKVVSGDNTLIAVVNNVELSYNGTEFSAILKDDARVYGYLDKDNTAAGGEMLAQSSANLSDNIITSANNQVNFNMSSIINKFETTLTDGSTTQGLKEYFTKAGNYNMTFMVASKDTSKIDGISNFTTVSEASQIESDLKSKYAVVDLSNALGFSGQIKVGEPENPNPDITVTGTTTFTKNSTTDSVANVSIDLGVSNSDKLTGDVTYEVTTTLPSGLTFENNTISGSLNITTASTTDVTIKATDSAGKVGTKTFTISVTNDAPTISVESATATVKAGSTTTVTYTKADANSDSVTVTATSSDETKATVVAENGTATITGVAAGTATITLTPNDGSVNGTAQTVTVTVSEVVIIGGDTSFSSTEVSNSTPTSPIVKNDVTVYLAAGTLPSDFSINFDNMDSTDNDLGAANSFYITVNGASISVTPNGKYHTKEFSITANGETKVHTYDKSATGVVAF